MCCVGLKEQTSDTSWIYRQKISRFNAKELDLHQQFREIDKNKFWLTTSKHYQFTTDYQERNLRAAVLKG